MEIVKNKFGKIKSIDEAMQFIKDGISVMIAGFGGIGSSYDLIKGINKKGVKNLTLISIDAGDPGVGPESIIRDKQVRKLITSHIGTTPETGRLLKKGELEVELNPQGTLSERIRAGGVGIGGILTDIGMGTIIEDRKDYVYIGTKKYLIEPALTADVSIIKARKADEYGNLIYSKTARGLNPLMAQAAKITIVDADEIVPIGALDPEDIITPGAYVDIIIQGKGSWRWPWE